MPDGPLCAACHAQAVRRRGRCAGCDEPRLLPGTDENGAGLCVGCAGIDRDYTCSRCGTEWAQVRGLCEWCQLGDVLDRLLNGDVDLSPLRARLLAVARPDSIIIWLYQPQAKRLLQELAIGTVPLTHAGLDGFRPRGFAEHLRGLLVASGLLPTRDELLARFDRYLSERLASFAATSEHLKLLNLFALWQLRPQLVTRSELAPLREEQVNNATQNLRIAADLLGWLHERGHDLSSCTQAVLDEWFVTPPGTHRRASSFVRWAMRTRRCQKLVIPPRRHGAAPVLDNSERLDILRQLLSPDSGRLEHRVATTLLVLLGQRFTTIAALGLEDVVIEHGEVGVRLGEGIAPIPPPFAAMFEELVARRPNLNTATNPTSPWLFPGRTTLNHLTPGVLRKRAMDMGINLVGARSGALRQLVLDCPPPVVADMLGYGYQAMDRHAIRAGSPWSSYAALRAQGQLPTDPLDTRR
jgi:hypothetical protein